MTKPSFRIQQVDVKGRLTLSKAFAGKTVIVEGRGNELVVRLIPEREVWLHENPAALASVRRGLQQARERKLSKGPDLDRAKRIGEQMEND
jgi:hypothetical protein